MYMYVFLAGKYWRARKKWYIQYNCDYESEGLVEIRSIYPSYVNVLVYFSASYLLSNIEG